MYEYVLFDLDGTLTDSGPGIRNCTVYALEYFGIVENDINKLNLFIGPPLVNSFQEFYGFSLEKSKEAVIKYRERYNTIGKYENTVYDGIEELLQKCKSLDKKLVLATSKPEFLAVDIMEHFGLAQYFDLIVGSKEEEGRKSKADVIQYCLDTMAIEDRKKAIMVGDRKYDIVGAREKGLDCIAVLFGYGNREEFEAARAAYIVETPEEIIPIISQ